MRDDSKVVAQLPDYAVPVYTLSKDIFVRKVDDAINVERDTEAAIAASAASGGALQGNSPGTPVWAKPDLAKGKNIGNSKSVPDDSSSEVDQDKSIDAITAAASDAKPGGA